MSKHDRLLSSVEYRCPKRGPVQVQVMWNDDDWKWKAWVDSGPPVAEGCTKTMRTGIILAHLARRKHNKKRLAGPVPVEL